MKQNYSIKNEIFCLEEIKNIKTKALRRETDLELVVVGKPYDSDGKPIMEVFSLKFYLPFKVPKHPVSDTKYLENLLNHNFKGQRVFVICPNELKTKNKDMIYYKSYNDIIKGDGKKFFGIKDTNFKESESSTKNFNQLVDMFNDEISSIFKTFKINC